MSPLRKQGARAKKLDSCFRGNDKYCFRNKSYLGRSRGPGFKYSSVAEAQAKARAKRKEIAQKERSLKEQGK